MNLWMPWLETASLLVLAWGTARLGLWLGGRPGKLWIWGYLGPMGIVLLFGILRFRPELRSVSPWVWLCAGRVQFAIITPVSAMLFWTLSTQVKSRGEQRGLRLLGTLVILSTSAWPFLAPAFNQAFLKGLQTRFDAHGVCLQSTDYTCGPASAVTALRRLGVEADEGSIALEAHTSTACGTPPDILASTLNRKYGVLGIEASVQFFRDVDEFATAGLTLAVIRYGFLVDHYVTVIEVGPRHLVVGDPASGLTKIERTEFAQKWRNSGVTLRRPAIPQAGDSKTTPLREPDRNEPHRLPAG